MPLFYCAELGIVGHLYWSSTLKHANAYPPLGQDLDADAAIIGGGISGSICAYLLAKAGLRTVLLDRGEVEFEWNAIFGASRDNLPFMGADILLALITQREHPLSRIVALDRPSLQPKS